MGFVPMGAKSTSSCTSRLTLTRIPASCSRVCAVAFRTPGRERVAMRGTYLGCRVCFGGIRVFHLHYRRGISREDYEIDQVLEVREELTSRGSTTGEFESRNGGLKNAPRLRLRAGCGLP